MIEVFKLVHNYYDSEAAKWALQKISGQSGGGLATPAFSALTLLVR